MATLGPAILNRLGQDATYANLSPGGIYLRDLKRNLSTDPANPTKGSTPDAWETTPPFRIRPATVVRASDQNASPGGHRSTYFNQPRLLFYAWPTESGRQRIEDMVNQARTLLNGWSTPLDGGATALLEVIPQRFGFQDDDEFGAVYDSETLENHGIWRNVL